MCCTTFSCRGSVVRIKSSLVMFRTFQSRRKFSTVWSASCRAVRPLAAAACWIFWPCSSVPVRKVVGSPSIRWCRASTSAAMVV